MTYHTTKVNVHVRSERRSTNTPDRVGEDLIKDSHNRGAVRATGRAFGGVVPVNSAAQSLLGLVPEETKLQAGIMAKEIIAEASGVGPAGVLIRPRAVLCMQGKGGEDL